MRFNLIKAGRIPLPKGIAKRSAQFVNPIAIERRGVSQTEPKGDDVRAIKARLTKLLGVDMSTDFDREDSLLAYRSVEPHDDDWRRVRVLGKDYAPAFLHVVLQGSFELRVGTVRATFRRGDVFYLNPNVTHEVRAKRLCMSYCFTRPSLDFQNAPPKGAVRKPNASQALIP